MKKTIDSLLQKLSVLPNGRLSGGFTQIRGGMRLAKVLPANGYKGEACTNSDGCGGTTNIESCTNKASCSADNTRTCSNPTVCN